MRRIEQIDVGPAPTSITLTPLEGETIRVLSVAIATTGAALQDFVVLQFTRGRSFFASQTSRANAGNAFACWFIGGEIPDLSLVSTVVATGVAVYDTQGLVITGQLPEVSLPFTFNVTFTAVGSIVLQSGQVLIERYSVPAWKNKAT